MRTVFSAVMRFHTNHVWLITSRLLIRAYAVRTSSHAAVFAWLQEAHPWNARRMDWVRFFCREASAEEQAWWRSRTALLQARNALVSTLVRILASSLHADGCVRAASLEVFRDCSTRQPSQTPHHSTRQLPI